MSKPVINSELIWDEDKLPLGSTKTINYFESSKGLLKQGNRAYITINNARNSFVDTSSAYISFTVQNLTCVGTVLPINTTPYNYDAIGLSAMGASSFIQSIDILQNNALVSRIDNVNKINGILQVSNSSNVGQDPVALTSGNSRSVNSDLLAVPIVERYGKPLATSTATSSISPTMTFTLNSSLLSFMGEGSLVPIGELKGSVEIQVQFINDIREAVVAKYGSTITSATAEFINVCYVAPIIKLDQSSYDAVVQENGFGKKNIMFSGVGHHCSTQLLTIAQQNTNAEYTLLVPNNRFSSLRHLHVGGFYSQSANNQEDKCIPRIPISTLQYRMNGKEYPQQRLDTLPKCLNNTLACNSSVNNSVGTTLMNSKGTTLNNRQAILGGAETYANRGVVGLSLETFNDTESVSGINVSQSDTEALVSTNGATAVSDSVLAFVSTYDVVYIINDQGVLSSSYT